MQRMHFLIRGRVQHVGFRYFVLRYASKLKLQGWVKNNVDRTVEVYACGENKDLLSLINACKKGPAFSFVTDLSFLPVDEQEGNNSPMDFKIIR